MKIYNEGTAYQSIDYEISDLIGKVITEIKSEDDRITFRTEAGDFALHHVQDCCECVVVESITGDLDDLLNTPILIAEERTSEDDPPDIKQIKEEQRRMNEYSYYDDDSQTWTFYTLRSIKGSVDIRWHGSSNGYYSESVEFSKV